MHDQANELRELVRLSADTTAAAGPRQLVVMGGKGGVGSSTLAVNLAMCLAQAGRRTVLIDADLQRADATAMCGLEEPPSIADVFAGRLSVHEALRRGPSGLQILPGSPMTASSLQCPVEAHDRLLSQLADLEQHADLLVIDAGNSRTLAARRFWQSAHEVLLVTTPDSMAIMDAYGTLKLYAQAEHSPHVRAVVNLASDDESARDVYSRLAIACNRFLGMRLAWAGFVPYDTQVPRASAEVLMLSAPSCPAAVQIRLLAEAMPVHVANRQASKPGHWLGARRRVAA